MLRSPLSLLVAAFALGSLSAHAQDADNSAPGAEVALTPPAAGLTKTEAMATFAKAMLACLGTRLQHKKIAELPPELFSELQPATDAERQWAGPNVTAQTPVWITKRLGHILTIAEPSLDDCEVSATQLPVEQTLGGLAILVTKGFPQFTQVPLKPGYDPIAYQYELIDHDTRFVIHMEGAEPGLPGHALRFSLIIGEVVRQPATDKPPFR
jgi:hypothetical protein